MRLVPSRCSIVLVGTWNLAIFAPRFVSRLLRNEQFEVQVSFGDALLLKFAEARAELVVSAPSVQAVPRAPTLESLTRADEICDRVLEILNETPIRALGINLGFELTRADPPAIPELVQAERATPEAQRPTLRRVRVQRTLEIDAALCNVAVGSGPGGARDLQFNYHFDLTVGDPERPSQRARDLLRHRSLATVRRTSAQTARDLFGLEEEP